MLGDHTRDREQQLLIVVHRDIAKPAMRFIASTSAGAGQPAAESMSNTSRALCGKPRRSRRTMWWPMSSAASQAATR